MGEIFNTLLEFVKEYDALIVAVGLLAGTIIGFVIAWIRELFF